MSRRLVSLAFIVAFAFVSVVPGTAIAQPRRTGALTVHTAGFPTLTDLLAQAWNSLTRLWDKEGCLTDPNGVTSPGSSAQTTPPTQGEAGCLIDPNGLCMKSTGR